MQEEAQGSKGQMIIGMATSSRRCHDYFESRSASVYGGDGGDFRFAASPMSEGLNVQKSKIDSLDWINSKNHKKSCQERTTRQRGSHHLIMGR